MGTCEVYEEKLRRGNLDYDPTTEPGVGSARCPRCLSPLNPIQPQDFLPDPSSDGFHDEVKELRERAKEIPDDYFVVLVGDMITEEALPTYQTMLNTLDGGVRDETGASPTPWAVWTNAAPTRQSEIRAPPSPLANSNESL